MQQPTLLLTYLTYPRRERLAAPLPGGDMFTFIPVPAVELEAHLPEEQEQLTSAHEEAAQ